VVSAAFNGATKALRSSAGERTTGMAADNCSASASRSMMSRCLTMLGMAFLPCRVRVPARRISALTGGAKARYIAGGRKIHRVSIV
jgi:hypothetical protein